MVHIVPQVFFLPLVLVHPRNGPEVGRKRVDDVLPQVVYFDKDNLFFDAFAKGVFGNLKKEEDEKREINIEY